MTSPIVVADSVHRGWPLVRMRSDALEVDVVPAKGGDILQVRWLPGDLPVLWSTPWGLAERGWASPATDSYTSFMEHYPGGWQTIFPNGGRATMVAGVEQPFHGEACRAAWECERAAAGIVLRTRLVRSPFELTKTIVVDGARLVVEETARNVGPEAFDAMWSHHPAFGVPFLDGDCVLETAARTFVVDALHEGDLVPGRRAPWPDADGRDGPVDLRRVPSPGADVTRLGYLTDLERGEASITSPSQRARATLEWDVGVMPHAWLWLEAGGTTGFPVYGSWYVLAIEPASSYPGHGIDAARESGTLLSFEPGESRTARVSLTLSAV